MATAAAGSRTEACLSPAGLRVQAMARGAVAAAACAATQTASAATVGPALKPAAAPLPRAHLVGRRGSQSVGGGHGLARPPSSPLSHTIRLARETLAAAEAYHRGHNSSDSGSSDGENGSAPPWSPARVPTLWHPSTSPAAAQPEIGGVPSASGVNTTADVPQPPRLRPPPPPPQGSRAVPTQMDGESSDDLDLDELAQAFAH
eukprot:COSAG01_NODE_9778_length_2346_cov_3.760125_2_plen_203_part_00